MKSVYLKTELYCTKFDQNYVKETNQLYTNHAAINQIFMLLKENHFKF